VPPALAGTGGAGGSATGSASAHATGSGMDPSTGLSAFAQIQVNGGAGGQSASQGGLGGAASGQADAHSDVGDASAILTQIGGDGGASTVAAGRGHDSTLVNAVSGDAGGRLDLEQDASGGAGGNGPGSRGGDARSELGVTGGGGFALSITANAVGGDASSPDGSAAGAARGGDATVSVQGLDQTGALLEVMGTAAGGAAVGPNGTPGTPTLALVDGRSTAGGTIRAYGEADGGDAANAGSVDLLDAVTGDTSGSLFLFQEAEGGSGSQQAGSASSRLDRAGTFSSLEVRTFAQGGSATAGALPGSSPAAQGFAESDAHNDGGPVIASANAQGGDGSLVSGGSNAGRAEARASASSAGDGHDVEADATATGGLVLPPQNGTAGIGRPGDALATADAIAQGASSAFATSTATGGVGMFASGTAGGNAQAQTTATGTTGAVEADATAQAGISGALQADHPGVAQAQSLATGLALVTSQALAFGAASSSAQSSARSLGAVSRSDSALALSGPKPPAAVFLAAESDFRQGDTLERASEISGLGYDNLALVNALPNPSEAVTWAESSPQVRQALGSAPQVLGLGLLSATTGVAGSVSLELDAHAFAPDESLTVGFVAGTATLGAGDLLELEVSLDGKPIADRSFTTSEAAQVALADSLVEIGHAQLGGGPLDTLVVRYVSTSGFSSRLIVFAAPEAEPTLLVLAALASLAAARRART